jgi:hypothetical protein
MDSITIHGALPERKKGLSNPIQAKGRLEWGTRLFFGNFDVFGDDRQAPDLASAALFAYRGSQS